jgi:hypothetical protein
VEKRYHSILIDELTPIPSIPTLPILHRTRYCTRKEFISKIQSNINQKRDPFLVADIETVLNENEEHMNHLTLSCWSVSSESSASIA